MPAELDASSVLINPQVVRQSFKNLIDSKAHPSFAGYLCVCRESHSSGSAEGLKVNFKSFFDRFLRVARTPDEKPYVMPFAESKGSKWSPFFNRNVAGSYAPSSLRDVSPFQQVVKIAGSRRDANYSLVPDHAAIAKKLLLYGKPLGVVSLALFLYRDYGLHLVPQGPTALVTIFREEFGFRTSVPIENKAFSTLFADDSSQFAQQELFVTTTLT
jgi:hypothetical protein